MATFWGGALTNAYGFLTIESSSFIGNTALTGGAIFSNGIEVSIVNSTFSANSAANYGGGIDVQGGNVTIVHSTLYGNGRGGLNRSSGTLKLRNSIIAGELWSGLPRKFGREQQQLHRGWQLLAGFESGGLSHQSRSLDRLAGLSSLIEL